MSEFDNKASDWDKNLLHISRSDAIAKVLIKLSP